MSTIDRLSSSAAVSRLRGQAGRVTRAWRAQRPAVRLLLLVLPLVALAAGGYWAAGSIGAAGTRFLSAGRAFSSEDLITICRELDRTGISYRLDDHRVEVGAEQFDQAVAVVAKLNVGPRSISEIRESGDSFSELLATPQDREQRELLRREKMIERFIDTQEGVVWSVVCIQRPRPTLARNPRTAPSAFVYVEGESDRPLPSNTVRAISAMLLSIEQGLALDSITMMDRKGRSYLDPRDPSASRQTREEELRQKILEKLTWLKGVHVWVELSERDASLPAGRRPAAVSPAQKPASEEAGVMRPSSGPTIIVNGPADTTTNPAPPQAGPVDKVERGRVLVYVPRSFYLSRIFPAADHREPTLEEWHGAVARSREQIEKLVHLVVPAAWGVEVDTFADEPPSVRAASLPSGSEHRRIALDWGIIGAVAASVALLMAMGSWIQAARRPSRTAEPAPSGRKYREDVASESGPSERVRELIRRDPEAAASVLQRWATEGGRVS